MIFRHKNSVKNEIWNTQKDDHSWYVQMTICEVKIWHWLNWIQWFFWVRNTDRKSWSKCMSDRLTVVNVKVNDRKRNLRRLFHWFHILKQSGDRWTWLKYWWNHWSVQQSMIQHTKITIEAVSRLEQLRKNACWSCESDVEQKRHHHIWWIHIGCWSCCCTSFKLCVAKEHKKIEEEICCDHLPLWCSWSTWTGSNIWYEDVHFYQGNDVAQYKRPSIECKIRNWTIDEWKIFRKYHYLSSEHKPHFSSKDIYILEYKNEPIWYCSVHHFPHPITKNLKKIHRLVIRPDYQWLWIWIRFLEFVCDRYAKQWFFVSITTSSLSLLKWLNWRKNRICLSYKRSDWWSESAKSRSLRKNLIKTMSLDRKVWSFRYIPQK